MMQINLPAGGPPAAAIRLLRVIESFLAAPVPDSRGAGKSRWIAVVLALAVACFYIGLIVTNDNTNVGTSNGLWKSVDVAGWTHQTGLPLDSGELLYAATYGRLAWLIPDSLLHYGSAPPDVTFRKMAVLNALFGGAACGLVFLLALRLTRSRVAAAVIALTHASASFVMLNSINSEDIIPAYTFFLAATVCFFEFLRLGGPRWFLASALMLAVANLLHWTVMAPGLASFGAVFGWLGIRDRKWLAAGIAWLAVFLTWVQGLVLLAYPHRLIPIWVAVYPGKANAGGWVGLLAGKAGLAFRGMGNSFCNVAMNVSWAVLAISVVACLVTLIRPGRQDLKLAAVSALALFLVGEMGAVYSQPQDPQMQIQPMFILTEGMILLGAGVVALNGSYWRQALGLVTVVALAANAAHNARSFLSDRGQDSMASAGVLELNRLFPKDKAAIIWHGWEPWVTWQYVLLWPHHMDSYLRQNVLLASPFVAKRGITAAEAAVLTEQSIDGHLARGIRVVASPVWTNPVDDFASSMVSVTDREWAKTYLEQLKTRYRTGTTWKTLFGTFTELVPPEHDGQVGAGARGPSAGQRAILK